MEERQDPLAIKQSLLPLLITSSSIYCDNEKEGVEKKNISLLNKFMEQTSPVNHPISLANNAGTQCLFWQKYPNGNFLMVLARDVQRDSIDTLTFCFPNFLNLVLLS